jgi:hypothetical protein
MRRLVRIAMPGTWGRALVVLSVVGILTAAGVTPAHAGEAGRNCKTYYHYGDPTRGGFTVCVKLEHQETFHAWRANGSVTTTTPGMVLHTATTAYYTADGHYFEESKGPAATEILNIATTWDQCSGSHDFLGRVTEWVTWPDGTSSSVTATYTMGDSGEGSFYPGSC